MDNSVDELMNDHIVHHRQGSQDEPPGEAEGARGAAGAPACAGSCDPNFPVGEVILAGEELHTGSHDLLRLFPVPAFKCQGSLALVRGCQFEYPIVEPQRFPRIVSLEDFQGVGRSQVEKHVPGQI